MSLVLHRFKERRARTAAELIGAAESMIPRLRDRAAETEKLRRLPEETRLDIRNAGLSRLLQPAHFGGAEASLESMIDVMIPIAGGCPSTAWCLAQYVMHNYMIARWPAQAQEAVWKDPDSLVSGILIPRLGKARAREDGYVLTGSWPFVSGVEASDWCLLSAMVERENRSGEERYFIVPRADVTVLDTWHSIGLRGSGSQDVEVRGLFVPEHMTVPIDVLKGGDAPGRKLSPAAVFRLPVYMTFGIVIGGALVGMGESMFESFLLQCRDRRSLLSSEEVASYQTHQARIGEVSSSLQAAEALLRADCREMMEFAEGNALPTALERSNYRCNGAYAGTLVQRAAQTLWDLIGGRGVYEANAIARLYQDIAVGTRHATVSWESNATEHGRARLRMPLTNPSL